MAGDTASDTIQVSPEQSVIFKTHDVRDLFIKAQGSDWQSLVKQRLDGALPGTYELFDTKDFEEEVIGAVRVDDGGEFYLMPFSGPCRDDYLAKYSSHEDE